MSCMRWVISRIAETALPLDVCTDRISWVISSVAFAVCTASDLTSAATTAQPRPASAARRFNRGIERQQVGLAGDVLNELDDVADLLRDMGKRGNVLIGGIGVGGSSTHHLVGLAELTADLLNRDGKLRRGRRCGFDIG